jgi:hypothetical protein
MYGCWFGLAGWISLLLDGCCYTLVVAWMVDVMDV